MGDQLLEVFKALREHQHKYTYFLLTAAGAGFALAVSHTQGAGMVRSHLWLAAAVLAWGLSFWCGCRHLQHVGSTLLANGTMLSVQGGGHPGIGANRELAEAAVQGLRQAMDATSTKAMRYASWQFSLLVAGGCLYVAWHVVGMYLRTAPEAACSL